MTFVDMNTVLINCTDRLLEFFHLYAASTLSKGLVTVFGRKCHGRNSEAVRTNIPMERGISMARVLVRLPVLH